MKALKGARHIIAMRGRAKLSKNDRGLLRKARRGFTLIELLIVISIVGVMLSVSLPISVGMFESYKASLKAQEVMLYISGLRRDSFLYSEGKVISSKNDALTVDDNEKVFEGVRIRLDSPIIFYRNGTTSGGVIRIHVAGQAYTLSVGAPLGDLLLTRSGMV